MNPDKIDDLVYQLSRAMAAEADTPEKADAEEIYNYLDGHVRAWLDSEVI